MAVISLDVDLLDRAERRDLPTAHQELIARARAAIQGQVSSKIISSAGGLPTGPGVRALPTFG